MKDILGYKTLLTDLKGRETGIIQVKVKQVYLMEQSKILMKHILIENILDKIKRYFMLPLLFTYWLKLYSYVKCIQVKYLNLNKLLDHVTSVSSITFDLIYIIMLD